MAAAAVLLLVVVIASVSGGASDGTPLSILCDDASAFDECPETTTSTTGPGSSTVPIPPSSTAGPTTTRPANTTPPTTVVRPDLPEDPNIVFILVDDLRADEMELGFGRSLPGRSSALETELIDKGTTMEKFFITTPLCCPSRASILTGLYAHNHHVFGNIYRRTAGFGGYPRFFEEGRDEASLGYWLDQAGYRTGMVGKYMNGFPNAGPPSGKLPGTYIPPGWDDWYGTRFIERASYYLFGINENGTEVEYGAGLEPAYLTDVQTRHAVTFIEDAAAGDEPFFLYLSPNAPHFPMHVAPEYEDAHRDITIPVPLSLGEEDLSDKPPFVVNGATPRSERRFDRVTEQFLDMTLSLDDMIGAVVDALERNGVLENTYIFFVSDNGLLRGEHGLGGKGAAYEESILAPLVAVGPGIPAGATIPHLGLNIDIAPTIVELAGAVPTAAMDGESLVGPLVGDTPLDQWRQGVLLELRTSNLDDPRYDASVNNTPIPTYFAVRTADHIYIEYHTGVAEIYDLAADPYQLDAIPMPSVAAETLNEWQTMVRNLANCLGDDCRAASRGIDTGADPFHVICGEEGCTFTALGSIGDGDHVWRLGDGTTASGYQVAHSYPFPAEYEVTLEIGGRVAVTTFVTVPELTPQL